MRGGKGINGVYKGVIIMIIHEFKLSEEESDEIH